MTHGAIADIGNLMKSVAVAAAALSVLSACSSDIHGKILSRDGATVYGEPLRSKTSASKHEPVELGKLQYMTPIVIECYLGSDRSYRILYKGKTAYIDSDVSIALSDGSPLHPANIDNCG